MGDKGKSANDNRTYQRDRKPCVLLRNMLRPTIGPNFFKEIYFQDSCQSECIFIQEKVMYIM